MPCIRCGACCETTHQIMEKDVDLLEWCAARGFKMVQDSEKYVEISVPHKCPQLGRDSNGKHYCCLLIGGDLQPKACKNFPDSVKNIKVYGLDPKKSLPNTCGYEWDEEREGFV